MRSPHHTGFTPNELTTPEQRAQNALYNEIMLPYDAPYGALAKFYSLPGIDFSITCFRALAQGDLDDEGRDNLQRLIPCLQNAIRLQHSLEDQAAHLVCGTFDRLSMCAFLCGPDGTLVHTTAAADVELRQKTWLKARGKHLSAVSEGSDADLKTALALVSKNPSMGSLSVVLRSPDAPPRVADVTALPPLPGLGSGAQRISPRAMVILPQPRRENLDIILQKAYALSAAEADIAVRLLNGQRLDDIAMRRQSSIHTVRTQLKAILSKTDTTAQSELIILMMRLLG